MAGNPVRTKYDGNEIFKALINKKGDILFIKGMDVENAEKIGIDEQREEELLQEIEDLQTSVSEAIERLEGLLADRDKFKKICIDNNLWQEPLTAEQIAIAEAQEQTRIAREEAAESKALMKQMLAEMRLMQSAMQANVKEAKPNGETISNVSNDKTNDTDISADNGKSIRTGKIGSTKVS